MRSALLAAIFVLAYPTTAHAQKDASGCNDHPLLPSRIPGFIIGSCEANDFGTADFGIDALSDPKHVEGKKTMIRYDTKEGAKPVSSAFVVKNYVAALQKIGGKKLFENDISTYATIQLKKDGRELWVGATGYVGEGTTEATAAYLITIIEKGDMQQVVSAADIFDELSRTGRVALYVQFDSGKSDIKPESDPLIEQMARVLTQNKALKVFIVGHTDTDGALDSNRKLSTDRARAVLAALTTKHRVEAGRLIADGVGPLSPIASNDNDAGKKLNRRVELVKR